VSLLTEKLGPHKLEPINRLQVIKYAGASGDYNPIHTIDDEAKKTGLPGVIAHGMLTMALMSNLFSSELHRGFVQDYTIRFSGMVFIDDVLTIEATLKEKNDRVYTYEVIARNQNEVCVASGSLSFKLL
jgi:acyl dehydratase